MIGVDSVIDDSNNNVRVSGCNLPRFKGVDVGVWCIAELACVVQVPLLVELRALLGAQFPLPAGEAFDVDEAWPTCGNWLVRNGYFGQPKAP